MPENDKSRASGAEGGVVRVCADGGRWQQMEASSKIGKMKLLNF